MSTKMLQYREHIMDKAARRAWLIIGIVAAIFMIGLFIVSMWGGPYQASSAWQKEEPPAFPN